MWAKQGQFTVPAHYPGLASGELLEKRMVCMHLPWALSVHHLQRRDCPKPGSGTPTHALSLSILDCDPHNRTEHCSLTITIVYNLPLISHFPSLSYKMPIYSGIHPTIRDTGHLEQLNSRQEHRCLLIIVGPTFYIHYFADTSQYKNNINIKVGTPSHFLDEEMKL